MDLFLWGEGHSPLPMMLKSTHSRNARKIFCGDQCTSLVNEHGEVFTWGKDRGGRLGHKTNENVPHPKLVDSLVNEIIESIACGARHTCALTTLGQVFAWGDDYQGDVGVKRSPWLPSKLSLPYSGVTISKIACGDWHTALVSSSGQLFTFGDGGFGVLGHGDLRSFSEPKEVEALRGMKVKAVACGLWHTAAVVELGGEHSEGRLFTWGDNEEGKLGHPWKRKTLLPSLVASLEDQGFVHVSCGVTMTAAITINGKLFVLGSSSLVKIEGALEGEFVKEISCGSFHVAVLTLKGEVYTWGKGANGRLGHGDTEDRIFPVRVEALRGRLVRSVACGSSFTAALCSQKPVYDKIECSGCRSVLGFMRKKHTCCSCGQVFCSSCTRSKAIKKQSRVCESCLGQLQSSSESEASSPRLAVFLKKGLLALKNDARKVTEPANKIEGLKDCRRWGQVACPAFFCEFQTGYATKREDESKMGLPSSRLQTEFKKPGKSLFAEIEQLRKEVSLRVYFFGVLLVISLHVE